MLTNIQAWVQESTYAGSNPPATDFTAMCIGRINSDTGSGTQLIISRSFASDDGIALYYDNSADQSAALWFLDLGLGGAEQGAFGTRIPLNTLCLFAFTSSTSNVTGYYKNLEDASAAMQSASTTNPISGQGATLHMSISSNANGADQTVMNWRVWEGVLTAEELQTEAFSTFAVRRTGLKWDVPFDDGDITETWPDFSGNGYNPENQAGGTPTNVANPPGMFDVVHDWAAMRFVTAAGGDVTVGATGSAGTMAAGTQTPNIAVPL